MVPPYGSCAEPPDHPPNNCTATLSSNLLLHVPVITFNDETYWADFQGDSNMDFVLTDVGFVTDKNFFSACTAASLSPNFALNLPAITFENAFYWADFMFTQDLLFTLTGEGQLPISTILSDDFTSPTVDAGKWHIPTWVSSDDGTYIGQTQFRCTQNAQLPDANNSNALIALNTYNPTGSGFYGTDLISNQPFSLGQRITVTVRAKIAASIPPGIVGGIFLYAPPNTSDDTLHDEIDFEILSNDLSHIHTNIYGNEPLGFGHPESHAYASGSASDYHTYQIQWMPDQVSWYVDGTLIRTVTTQSPIPKGPMYVHLNIWVPDSDFTSAYDPNLQWASAPSSDQTYLLYVDSLTVVAENN